MEKKQQITIITIEKEAKPLMARASQLEIKDEQSLTVATEILSQANVLLKSITTARKAETGPLKQEVKELEAKYEPTEDALDSIIKQIRADMSSYQTKQVQLLWDKENAISDRVGAGKGKLKVETAVAQIDELDRPAEKTATASGSVTFRPKNTLKITSLAVIP